LIYSYQLLKAYQLQSAMLTPFSEKEEFKNGLRCYEMAFLTGVNHASHFAQINTIQRHCTFVLQPH